MLLSEMTGETGDEEAFLVERDAATPKSAIARWRRPVFLAVALAGSAGAAVAAHASLTRATVADRAKESAVVDWAAAPRKAAPPAAAAPAKAAHKAPKKKEDDDGVDRSACATPDDDCSEQKCCADPGFQCFRRDAHWAQCMKNCTPGVHGGPYVVGKVDWNCAIIAITTTPEPTTPTTTTPIPCAKVPGEDCTASKCCDDPEQHCWEKNEWYATCMPKCEPGVHKKDSDKKPWSCKQLLPWMNKEATTDAPKTLPGGNIGPPVTCEDGPIGKVPPFSGYKGQPAFIKILTYNLFWWNLFGVRHGNHNSAGLLIKESNSPIPWDLMAFQECEDGEMVVGGAGLLATHEVFSFAPMTKTTAICFTYRRAAFDLLGHGQEWLAEDAPEQYFGKRAAQWMRLMHKATGKPIFWMNHHGPLPVNTGGKCGGHATAMHLVRSIQKNAVPGDAIFLAGDFNADDASETLAGMKSALTDFVPAGIDNIFSNLPHGSLVRNMDIGNGGSDHEARLAVFQLGGGCT